MSSNKNWKLVLLFFIMVMTTIARPIVAAVVIILAAMVEVISSLDAGGCHVSIANRLTAVIQYFDKAAFPAIATATVVRSILSLKYKIRPGNENNCE